MHREVTGYFPRIFSTTTSCDQWERQWKEEKESKTRFAISFGGATCCISHFSVAVPNSTLGHCRHSSAIFNKNYSHYCNQAYAVEPKGMFYDWSGTLKPVLENMFGKNLGILLLAKEVSLTSSPGSRRL